MGNHNISPTISKEEIKQFQNSNLIWLDSNVNNSENTIYQNLIKKISQIKFYTFTEINKCIQKLTKINFEKTFVLVSGTLSKKFFTEIEKIKNQLKVIEVIIDPNSGETTFMSQSKIYYFMINVFCLIQNQYLNLLFQSKKH